MKQKKPNYWMWATITLLIVAGSLITNLQIKITNEEKSTVYIGNLTIPEESLNSLLVNFKVGDIVKLCDVENDKCVKIQLRGG